MQFEPTHSTTRTLERRPPVQGLNEGQASRLPSSAQPTALLALTRSLGSRDACPSLRFVEGFFQLKRYG